MAPTYSITTLGCKVNQYDGSAIAQALANAGFGPAPAGQRPDLAVINTCCVTTTAMRKSRLAIRRALRREPAAVLVCGCYSDYDGPALRNLLAADAPPGCDLYVAGHQDDLPDVLRQIASCGRLCAAGVPPASCGGMDVLATAADTAAVPPAVVSNELTSMSAGCDDDSLATVSRSGRIKSRRLASVRRNNPQDAALPSISHFDQHQRAFVKVQDGCDAFCSYCVVPYARSVLWSRPIHTVVEECRTLLAGGHKEIVLAGVFLGAYGRATALRRHWDSQPSQLPQLVRAVAAIEGLWRVRLSSLEPGDLNGDLLEVIRTCPTVAPHFHLPLQSGSDTVLARMNRQYDVHTYLQRVQRLNQAIDRPAVTTDLIVGFPGESDEDFEQTLQAAEQAGLADIHAFTFSAIEGTAAWVLRHQCPPDTIVRQRLERLEALRQRLAERFCHQFIGEELEGVVERPTASTPNGYRQAMSDRHMTIYFQAAPDKHLTGQVLRFKILDIYKDGLLGAHGRCHC